MENKKLSYEEALKELENIVGKLEKDETSLNNSIDIFKRGVELYKYCNKLLSDAENEVKLLLDDSDDSIIEVNFFGEDEKNNF
ncbi:MAG: exodeoxyribonuclease VII small subunit [Tissierella sp.]|uniref:exodeoxyribonuclease VII small subunit n=1 Tax=Tissierella sp. TaxID=41274 RepID=UPI003F9A43BC